jgi:hypothetical protein
MPASRKDQILLFPEDERGLVADVGAPILVSVRAVDASDLSPIADVRVRFQVLDGPLGLGTRRGSGATARTDADGVAAVPAVFVEPGAALVTADLIGVGDGEAVLFGVHSEGTTHLLVIDLPITTPAQSGAIPARVTAFDHHGMPARLSDTVLEASQGGDTFETVRLVRRGPGQYEGLFRTRRAGVWRFRAYDRTTKVVADAWTTVLPGDAKGLRFVEPPDPRRDPPYNQVWVRARIEDQFGNAVDPGRIELDLDGATTQARVNVEGEARFLVAGPPGFGFAKVQLHDSTETVPLVATDIYFAAAWIGDPGFVAVEENFTTPLFLMPPADSPLAKGKIFVKFNSRRARFAGWRPSRTAKDLGVTTETTGNSIVLTLNPRRPIAPRRRRSEPLDLGFIDWQCAEEGQTCFDVSAEFSPETPPWKKCVQQKRRRQKCLCINYIYRAGDTKGREAGRRAMRSVVRILSTQNIRRCCPSLRLDIHSCSISASDWTRKVLTKLGDSKQVKSHEQVLDLFRLNLCQRAKCMNFLMIDMDHSYADGDAGSYGPQPGTNRAFGVINPAYVDTVHNIGAHEVGHMLGLRHVNGGQGDNVMSETQPHGDNLTEKQCEDLYTFLDVFAC